METANRMLLEDAIETSIKAEMKILVLQRIIAGMTVVIFAMAGVIIWLI